MAPGTESLAGHRGMRASPGAAPSAHRTPPPGHGSHGNETLVGMPWLLRLRWGAVAGQCIALGAARVLLAANLPWALMGALVALTATSNVGLSMISSRARGERLIPIVLVGDALVLTAMLVASGGPANPFSVFFLVHVALASLLLPPRAAWGLVGLTVLAFGSLFLWPGQDHHAHVHPVGATHLVGMWVSYAFTASFVAYFIGKVSQALRDRDRDLAAVERLALQNERLATLSSFSANAAHELATPLATIGLAAKELAVAVADRPGTGRLQADADLICREVARCRTILADIAARAGESMGEMPTRTTPREVVRALPPETASCLVVRFDGEGAADALVVVPKETLAQMLTNLVKNALDAHDRAAVGEPIELAVTVDGLLVFHVLDRGPGLPAAIEAQLGEPFVTTKAHAGGLGLGVYLVRSFAERLGGRLVYSARPGGGLDAELALPIDAIGGRT
jgi:two-component system sensor histidine kinase RegB